jgi:hypothetical protein
MSDDEEVLVITLGGLTLTAQSYQAAHGSAVRLTIEPLARGPQARVPPVASSSSTSLPRAQYPGSSSTARAPLLADFFEVPTSEVCPAEVLLRASVLEPAGGSRLRSVFCVLGTLAVERPGFCGVRRPRSLRTL